MRRPQPSRQSALCLESTPALAGHEERFARPFSIAYYGLAAFTLAAAMMAIISATMLGCVNESVEQDAEEGAASTPPAPADAQATSAPNLVTVKQVRSYNVGPDLFVEFSTTNTSQTYTEFLLLKIVLQDAQGGAVATGELSLDDVNPAETITKSASFGPVPDLSRVSQWTVEVLSPAESFRAARQ